MLLKALTPTITATQVDLVAMVAMAFFCSITLGRTEEALTILNMIRDTWK